MRSYPILGVTLDIVTLAEATELILRLARKSDGRPRHIVTINPELIIEAALNPNFRELIERAELRTADGMGVRLAADFLLTRRTRPKLIALLTSLSKALLLPERLEPFPEVVTGVELLITILPRAAAGRLTILCLGSTPAVLRQFETRLRRQYPELSLITHPVGQVTVDGRLTDNECLRELKAVQPHLLCTSFGSPKGQRFIARYQKRLGANIALEVGGAIPYLAETVSRAPSPVRRRGFEWLWRLMTQPWRINRIVTATVRFLSEVYKSA